MNDLVRSEFPNLAKICDKFGEMMLQIPTQSEMTHQMKAIRGVIKANHVTNESNCFLFNATPTQELICITEMPRSDAAMELFGNNVKLFGATIYIGENNAQLSCGLRSNGDNATKSYVWLNTLNPCDGYKIYFGVHFVQSHSSILSKDESNTEGSCAACSTLKRQYETILDELEKINQNLSRRRRFVEDTL